MCILKRECAYVSVRRLAGIVSCVGEKKKNPVESESRKKKVKYDDMQGVGVCLVKRVLNLCTFQVVLETQSVASVGCFLLSNLKVCRSYRNTLKTRSRRRKKQK